MQQSYYPQYNPAQGLQPPHLKRAHTRPWTPSQGSSSPALGGTWRLPAAASAGTVTPRELEPRRRGHRVRETRSQQEHVLDANPCHFCPRTPGPHPEPEDQVGCQHQARPLDVGCTCVPRGLSLLRCSLWFGPSPAVPGHPLGAPNQSLRDWGPVPESTACQDRRSVVHLQGSDKTRRPLARTEWHRSHSA